MRRVTDTPAVTGAATGLQWIFLLLSEAVNLFGILVVSFVELLRALRHPFREPDMDD